MTDNFDKSTILDSFLDEVTAYLPEIEANLDRLQQSPGDTEALEETYRRAHTIGGSAAMMDFPALARVAQGMEEILSEAMERGAPLTGATIALLRRSHGRLSRLVEHIRTGADDGPVVAEDDADRSAWRGTIPNSASGFEASGPGLRSQPGFNGGAPAPGASGGIQTSPGLQAPEWMAAFAASNANGQQQPPPEDFADRPTGAPPAVIPGSSSSMPGTSTPGADIAELGTRAMQAMPAAPSTPSNPPGSQPSRPGATSFPSDPSRPAQPAQPSQPAWDISQPATMPIQSPFIAPSPSASSTPAPSASNLPATQGGGMEGSVVDELYTDEEAVRRQVGQLRDVVAQLRQAAQTMDEERTELSSFLDGSQDALARLEVWAGQQMGLDLPSSPDGVRQYLPLSVIWVTTARLKRLVTLIHNSSRNLTVTQEQIDETLNELRDAIRGLGNISGAISTMGGSPEAGFSATVAQITWAPGGGGEQQALSPGARVEIERSVREELRRELEDDVRDEIASEVRQSEEQRLRHELEIAIRRELLAELQPNLGSSAVTIQDGGVRVLSRLPFASENVRRQRQVTSEQSPEAQEVFREEALEHLQTITRGIEELEHRPGDVEVIRSIRRAMHTLKGAAGMMGFRLIQELSHVSEDLLERLADGQMAFTPNVHSLILDTSEMLDQLVAGAIPAEAQPAKVRELIERYSALTGIPISDDLFSSHPGARSGLVDLTEPDDRPDVAPKRPSSDLSVRLQLSKLDDLVNLFGELLINRSVLEERIERLGQLVGETTQVSERLRDIGGELETGFETTMLANGQGPMPMARPGPGPANGMAMRGQVAGNGFGGNKGRMPAFGNEFDPLELDRYTDFHRLSRGLSEGVTDAMSLSHEMETLIREAQTTFARENRLSSDFQDRLLKARLVPLQSLTPRLYRAVRGSALRARKEVEFFVEGVETEVDRKVFEEVEGPLLHLVRNAVNHGIEAPEEREANGKQRAGRILVKAAYEGSQVIISVSDDGAGIDPEKVRAAAVARGLIDAYTPISEKEAIDFIFRPGYSTAESVTEESGRGVGLDVVNDVVTRLRGSVEVDTVLGQGTTFTMKFPISLQIARAVMVKVGDQILAIPMAVVEQIGRLDYYRRVPGAVPAIEMRGERYPLAHLGNYLKVPVGVVDERSSVLLVNAGKHRIALLIDSIVNQQEIVSKPLGPHLRDVRGVAGATVLGNGQIVLILELHELLSQQPRGGFTLAEPGSSRRAESPEPPQRPASAPAPQPQVTSSHLPTEPLPPAPWDRASQPGGPASQHFTGSPSQPAQRAFVIPQRTTGHPVVAGQPHSYILVVDDSPSVRRVVSGMLKNAGWAVQTARDGVEALEIIGRERPAAVLLDIEMPRMDGYELIATIRSQDTYRNLPLIVLTSRAATKHKQRADQLGADAYLVKPYQDEQLVTTLNSLINARG
ncbi:MAG TPA: response regulator [Ktedonobacterales bacterium]|jgi:chemotaxis protein histidine kinase CheA/ActR/RegA family two-component response regulator